MLKTHFPMQLCTHFNLHFSVKAVRHPDLLSKKYPCTGSLLWEQQSVVNYGMVAQQTANDWPKGRLLLQYVGQCLYSFRENI